MAKYHEGAANKIAKPSPQSGQHSTEFANMPTALVMKEYPKAQYSGPVGYDDSRDGIDMLAAQNHSKMMKKGSR